jgi:hypothetical protein
MAPVRGDAMAEGTSKAIPLRRRGGGRNVEIVPPRSWSETLTVGVRSVLAQPRQLWLASLGGVALTVRGLRSGWTHLVAAGESVEGLLRSVVGRGTEPTPGS